MTDREHILSIIRARKPEFSKYGIKDIGLFGSFARDEQTETSDIDILIDFEPGKETFDNYMAFCDYIETLFRNQRVEIVTKNGLSPYIGPKILNEVKYV
ncbi:MAG: nucleotidyltransferase family protein [Bacteroidales bacterium]|nr:nucleotidyltransferase family protein [Bacteroidales bacterium]